MSSSEEAPVKSLQNAMGEKGQGEAPQHGEAGEQGTGGGNLLMLPKSAMNCGG